MIGMPSHPVRLFLLAVAALVSFTHTARAEDIWTEIQSPHFRVLTNGSSREGRKVANEFEQMRYVFAVRFNNAKLETGAPLTIVAVKDENTFRKVEPNWKYMSNVAGEFHHGWEKQFALIRLDTWGDENQVVVYHEYTHSVLHANAHWLPIWLDEGMAEFYGYTRFQSEKTLVGAPSRRLRTLNNYPLIPVSTMLTVDSRSPYYHDEEKAQIFYAEAWAMVHFMVFGQGTGNESRLGTFFQLIQDNVPQDKAFQQVFGDPKVFQGKLSEYLNHFSIQVGVIPPDKSVDPKAFAEHTLTPAEINYELACFHIGENDRQGGRSLVDKSLALDPKLAGAHEELAFLNFDNGKDAEARQEWTKALQLDPKLPRSLFASIMSGPPLSQQTPDQLRTTITGLRHVTELAPNFAPAYVQIALVEWRLGNINAAYKDATKAETLEPWRAGYRILTANILLHGKQPAIAATSLRYVASHWDGPDHDEAVDLWQQIPKDQQGPGDPLTLELPAGTKTARGTIQNITCEEAPRFSIHVTLKPDQAGSQTVTFSAPPRFTSGFSDTLWYGSDHFSLCHHLAGYPAVVAYKPSEKQSELLEIEIRDDQPTSAIQAAATLAPATH